MRELYVVLLLLSLIVIGLLLWKVFQKTRAGKDLQISDIIGVIGILVPITGSFFALSLTSPGAATAPTVIATAPSEVPASVEDPKIAAAQAALARPGGLDEAIRLFEGAEESEESLGWLSMLYAYRNRDNEAVAIGRRAVELYPESAFAHAGLAVALGYQRNYNEAERVATRAIELDPQLLLAYATRAQSRAAQAYRQSNRFLLGAADTDAEFALNLLPSEPNAYFKAVAYDAKGRVLYYEFHMTPSSAGESAALLDRGISAFTSAYNLQPQIARFHSNLALLYAYAAQRQKEFGDLSGAESKFNLALEHYALALQNDPNYVSAQTGIGLVFEAQDKVEAALAAFEAAIKLDPNDQGAYFGKNRILRKEEFKNFDEAIQVLQDQAPAHPFDEDFPIELGWTYREYAWTLNDEEAAQAYKDAEQSFLDALKLNEHSLSALNGLGFILIDQNRATEAIEPLERSLLIKEDQSAAHNGVGWGYFAQREYATAERHFERATELDRSYAWPWQGLGSSRFALGRFSEAKAAFEQTIALEAENIEAREGLARITGAGTLLHEDDQTVKTLSLQVQFADAAIDATFVNPATSAWSYGFFVRDAGPNEYRLVANRQGNWVLEDWVDGSFQSNLGEGTLTPFDAAAEATHRLTAIVLQETLYLFHNGRFIATVQGLRPTAGDFAVGTGFFPGDETPGAETRFEGLSVRKLSLAPASLSAGGVAYESEGVGVIHNEPYDEKQQRYGLELRDFIGAIEYTNPYDPSAGSWSYGLHIRDKTNDDHYRFVVDEQQRARLILSRLTTVGNATVPGLNTAANATNRLVLIALADRLHAFVNDEYVALTSNVLDEQKSGGSAYGDVSLIVGGKWAPETPNAGMISYTNYRVWAIDPALFRP